MNMNTPSLPRRLACLFYEALLMVAVLAVGYVPYFVLFHFLPTELFHFLANLYWLALGGVYCTHFWRRGQTLAMKTWHIRVESAAGGPLTGGQAVKRYLLALLLFPVTWFWALFDRDRQFLHDRLAGTVLVNAAPSAK